MAVRNLTTAPLPPTLAGAPVTPRSGFLVLSFVAAGAGINLPLQWAPSSMDMDGLAQPIETLTRPGRRALARAKGESLPQLQFVAQFGYEDGRTGIDGGLQALEDLANSGEPFGIKLGKRTIGSEWIFSDLAWKAEKFAADGRIVRAQATIKLIAYAEVSAKQTVMIAPQSTVPTISVLSVAPVNEDGPVEDLPDHETPVGTADQGWAAWIENATWLDFLESLDAASIRTLTESLTAAEKVALEAALDARAKVSKGKVKAKGVAGPIILYPTITPPIGTPPYGGTL